MLWCRGDTIETKNPDLQARIKKMDQSSISYEIDEMYRQVKSDKGIKVYKEIA